MKVIIVQGMTCLGKSTLCKQLEHDLPKCKHFCLDEYKEAVWDKLGFDSVEERDYQSVLARRTFFGKIRDAIQNHLYDYILIDYTFTYKLWPELLNNIIIDDNIILQTLYLKPANLMIHQKIWEERSRNFFVRHAGHGATRYHDGVGENYVNTYNTKVFDRLPTTSKTLEIEIGFNPYTQSKSYEDILNFIQ